MYLIVEDFFKGIEVVLFFLNGRRVYVVIDVLDESRILNLVKVVVIFVIDMKYKNFFLVVISCR